MEHSGLTFFGPHSPYLELFDRSVDCCSGGTCRNDLWSAKRAKNTQM